MTISTCQLKLTRFSSSLIELANANQQQPGPFPDQQIKTQRSKARICALSPYERELQIHVTADPESRQEEDPAGAGCPFIRAPVRAAAHGSDLMG
jgi:hypothetical protein